METALFKRRNFETSRSSLDLTTTEISSLLNFIKTTRDKMPKLWEQLPNPVMMALNTTVVKLERHEAHGTD